MIHEHFAAISRYLAQITFFTCVNPFVGCEVACRFHRRQALIANATLQCSPDSLFILFKLHLLILSQRSTSFNDTITPATWTLLTCSRPWPPTRSNWPQPNSCTCSFFVLQWMIIIIIIIIANITQAVKFNIFSFSLLLSFSLKETFYGHICNYLESNESEK